MIRSKVLYLRNIVKKLLIGEWSIFFKFYLYFMLIDYLRVPFLILMERLMFQFFFIKDVYIKSYLIYLPYFANDHTYNFLLVYKESFRRIFSDLRIEFIIYQILALLVILFLVFIIDRYKKDDVGLSFQVKSVFLFVLGIIGASFVIFVVAVILYFNNNLIFLGFTKVVSPDMMGVNNMIVFQFVLYALVAVQEELFGRAFLIHGFKWAGIHLSIIIPSGIFALLHLGNVANQYNIGYFQTIIHFISLNLRIDSYLGILNIFLLALVFSIYFIKFKDLWLLIGAHFGWNFFMGSVLGMPVSNIEELNGKSFFSTKLEGSDFLIGGTFGPEGSIVTTIVLASILGVFLYILRKNKMNIA